jgi:hypothetical protein
MTSRIINYNKENISNSLKSLDSFCLPNEILYKYFELYEIKGRSRYILKDLDKKLSFYAKSCIYDSVESYFKIFYLDKINLIGEQKLYKLINEKLSPKNKFEELIVSIKNCFIKIESTNFFNYSNQEIINIAKLINPENKLKVKKTENNISLQGLLDNTKRLIMQKKHDVLSIIISSATDLYYLNFFEDNNLEISFIYLVLVISNNFEFTKYNSILKQLILTNRVNSIFDDLKNMHDKYLKGFPNITPLVDNFLSALLASYREVEHYVRENKVLDSGINKDSLIRKVIEEFETDIFVKEDIVKSLPNMKLSSIDRTLNILMKQNKIIPLGKGRSASWQKIAEENKLFE